VPFAIQSNTLKGTTALMNEEAVIEYRHHLRLDDRKSGLWIAHHPCDQEYSTLVEPSFSIERIAASAAWN
jgi:hypothetical protein